MQFNKSAIKATLFGILASASSAAFADHINYNPTPTPTPICYPSPTPGDRLPGAVPEPSAWIPLAIGALAIVALAVWNRYKASKNNA
jgi:hypothetical protein